MKNYNTDTFIEFANKKHNNKYSYEKTIYKNSRENLIITCPIHGDFLQKANNHLNGCGCKYCKIDVIKAAMCMTLEKFIEISNQIHNYKYDYNDVVYINNRTAVKITCKIHGSFLNIPHHHLKGAGCKKCSSLIKKNKRLKNTEYFIKKAIEIHGNLYNYSESNYISRKDKIDIICKNHGKFSQTASNHLGGAGCPFCKINNIGWTLTKWIQNSLKSKDFESYKVYIIRCWNDTEQFFKIGRTFVPIKYRFSGKKAMPYNYEVIKIIEDTAENIFYLETKMKKKNSINKYIPNIFFPGMKECFHKIEYNG